MTQHKSGGTLLAFIGWCFIASMTLYPTPDSAVSNSFSSPWCLVCGDLGVIDVTLNCLLFLPLGLGLGLRSTSRWRAVALIVGTTMIVEFLQLHLIPGRDASLSDLITNTIGGIAGFALASRWRPVLFPESKTSLRLASLGAVLWILVQTFTAFAMNLRLPESVYYGQWAPDLAQFQKFTGRVQSAELNGAPLPGSQLPGSPEIRSQLLSGSSHVVVRAMTGKVTSALAPIFSIYDENQREVLLLGQSHTDIIFRIRTRSAALLLRGPSIRLTDVLPELPGLPFEVRATVRPGHYQLVADIGGRTIQRELSASASWGWSLILPFDHAFGSEMRWLTMLWLAGLLLPIGYYAGRSQRVNLFFAAVSLAVLLVLGLIVVPRVSGLAGGEISEWIAACLGTVSGWWLGRRSLHESLARERPASPSFARSQ
ncbi:MAG: VanZ family protein [Gemmatimonadota bacterium]